MNATLLPAEMALRLTAAAARALDQDCAVEGLSRLSGGASAETWRFDLLYEGQRKGYILRRSATTESNRFSTAIGKATEAQIQRIARAHAVPAPPILFELNDADGLGEGYVMARVDGETLAPKILSLPHLESARTHLAAQCGEILARLHRIDSAHFPTGLSDQSALPQLDQLESLYRSFDQPQPVLEYGFRWLKNHAPPPTTLALVHGDFRNGNLVVNDHGIAAVLDWELCHLGDPAEDLGWLCVRSWRFGKPQNVVGGFGGLDDLRRAYEQAGGEAMTPERLLYWQAFGTLRWGVICLFQTFSHLRGELKSVELAAIGRRVSETESDLLELIC